LYDAIVVPSQQSLGSYNHILHRMMFSDYEADLDIVAHEYTHCVQWSVGFANTYSSGEEGAIHESFSDIFAIVIDFEVKGPGADWVRRKNTAPIDGLQRSLKDPYQSTPPQPKFYKGPKWDPAQEPHTNDGVRNYWFYLVAANNGDIVDPQIVLLGLATAALIADRAMSEKLIGVADYITSKDATINAATDICGEFSQERVTTQHTWFVLGVGSDVPAAAQIAPTNHATNVQPWPTTLRWQAYHDQAEWNWD